MMLGRRTINVVTNGVLDGLSNQALDRRLLGLAARKEAHDTLRFYRLAPTASVGRHQALACELRLDYCERKGIEIVRRLTGGGALYVDPHQLGFSLVTRGPPHWRNLPLAQLLQKLASVVARALRTLGMPARVKPPNDIEADGGKIASVYVVRSSGAVLAHGTVLLDADIRTMLESLRVPTEKLTSDGLAAARDRLATVSSLRGSASRGEVEAALLESMEQALGARARHSTETEADIAAAEREAEHAFARLITWDNDVETIESVTKTSQETTLRARAAFDEAGTILRRVEFATDAHLEPGEFLRELEDTLAGLPIALIADAVRHLTYRRAVQTCGFSCSELADLLQELAVKQRLRRQHGFCTREVNALMLHSPDRRADITAVLGKASVMLVPYCAKPAWCTWRHRDGCPECGRCEVGDAYRLARERGMQVTTVTSYEHLLETLRRMKSEDVAAYVGMCCSNFFIKRQRAFTEAGIPAVLMDVSGANCYELQQEHEAYAGTFSAESKLDRGLLERVLAFVPPIATGGRPPAGT